MPPALDLGRARHARTCLRLALERWNPADLAQVAMSRELLEQSVTDMQEVENSIRNGTAEPTEELSSLLQASRLEVNRLTRLVDAGAAFYRGVALRLGQVETGYTPSGQISAEPNFADSASDVRLNTHV